MVRTVVACVVALPIVALTVGAPVAGAQPPGVCNPLARTCADNSIVGAHPPGDTHITGVGIVRTIDCNGHTLLVNGGGNQITALGTCWAVTVQGNGNVVVADNVINDVTVYGWDQTVLYKNGSPAIWDRGRELGMTNIVNRVPA
ncbi:hypothetical protein BST36_22115 [Mycolicibacterium moriokaense]|jgi:hypothetical protein|uniref:Membrane protein n=1 Tax=Mycolicibacterium moriokaense TaxID=39691 RepID=A0AAD1HHV6_9MYCO|nr:DUF3060 domain-containing protein [Mycolicibacterium moriokaense]MCV7041449.1 DUF3060 domain-containing protein [Mycolicibacterium moriokaense]ORB19466.1 hypothetical protein BST36_22115 [Mycolicibacterium moriokaense]BBX04506.1 membrane protein [Mycolicibacterium moriokaense]